MSSSSCDCPKPPGGQINCPPNQMAVCRVVNGVAVGDCIDPPSFAHDTSGVVTPEARDSEARFLRKWAYTEITGLQPASRQALLPSELAILKSGIFEDPSRGLRVTFTLPPEFRTALRLEGESQQYFEGGSNR